MIIYIANRKGIVLSSASTEIENKSSIKADEFSCDVATGIRTVELTFHEDKELRQALIPGNFTYKLRVDTMCRLSFSISNPLISTGSGVSTLFTNLQ